MPGKGVGAVKKKHKPMTPTTEQAELMKRNGIHFPCFWLIVGNFVTSFAVGNIITGTVKVINYEQNERPM